MTQVSVAKREAEIRLDETDFGEKKKINKEKKLILTDLDEGSWPDEIDDMPTERRRKRRERRKRQRDAIRTKQNRELEAELESHYINAITQAVVPKVARR